MEAVQSLVGLLACPASLLIVVGSVTGTVNWTLGPLMQAARQKPAPTRFLLSDMLWLMVQLQLAMGLVAWAIPPDLGSASRIEAILYLCLPTAGFWYACLHAVSQAGIRGPLKRAVVFIVLFPGTIAAIIALPALTLALCLEAANRHAGNQPQWLAAQLIFVAAATFGLRWLARWTVA